MVRFGEAAGRLDQGECLDGRLGARQPIGALEQAEAGEEQALGDGAMGCRAGRAGGGGEGGEVDMRGQVGSAGIGERIGRPAIAQRLEAVAGSAVLGAVVEEERGAGADGQAVAEEFRDRDRGFVEFEDGGAFRPLPPTPSRKGRGSMSC